MAKKSARSCQVISLTFTSFRYSSLTRAVVCKVWPGFSRFMYLCARRCNSLSTSGVSLSSALSSPLPHALSSCVTSTLDKELPSMARLLANVRKKYHTDAGGIPFQNFSEKKRKPPWLAGDGRRELLRGSFLPCFNHHRSVALVATLHREAA